MSDATATQSYFYDEELHTPLSAQEIVREIQGLFNIDSVADFGCGKGQFLAAFKQSGVKSLHGYDGHWAREAFAQTLSPGEFTAVNFEDISTFTPPRTDLALSLEVAEHIGEANADEFVALLCRASDIVVFSAALPRQGGQHHVNEQPLTYWIEKFAEQGYQGFDALRSRLWQNENIEVWYRQNIFVFVKNERVTNELATKLQPTSFPLDIVHPEFYEQRIGEYESRLDTIYQGKIKPISYLYLFGKSIARRLRRG